MPDQKGSAPPAHVLARLTALFPAPLSWTGFLHTGVSAVKSVPGSPAWVQSETHPCHSCTCISLPGGMPLPRSLARTARAAGQPLAMGQGAGSPRQCCLELAPCGGLAMSLQAGSSLARHWCVVISLTFPPTCLYSCISRHGVCPPVLPKHPAERGAGQELWFAGWVSITHRPVGA